MGYFTYYLLSTVFLLVYLGLTWFALSALHLTGFAEMAVRSLIMAIGFGAYGFLIYYLSDRKTKKAAAAAGQRPQLAGTDEIAYLVRQAEQRLAASQLGKDANLGTLPV